MGFFFMAARSFLHHGNCEQHVTLSRSRQILLSLSGFDNAPKPGKAGFPYIRLSTVTQ
jgi:hypothetical protein